MLNTRLLLLTVLGVVLTGVLVSRAPSPQQTAKTSIEQFGGKTRSDKGQVVKIDLRKSRATDNDLSILKQFAALDRLDLPPSTTDAGLRQFAELDQPRLARHADLRRGTGHAQDHA